MEAQQRQPWKNIGKDSKRAAVELWRAGDPFGYYQEAAQDVWVYPEEDSGLCQEEPHLTGPEYAGGGVPAEPGAVHTGKDPGGDRQGWWHDEILI